MRPIHSLLVLVLALALPGCEAVFSTFQAGMWVGVIGDRAAPRASMTLSGRPDLDQPQVVDPLEMRTSVSATINASSPADGEPRAPAPLPSRRRDGRWPRLLGAQVVSASPTPPPLPQGGGR